MKKYKVVRYFDTYADGVMLVTEDEEEAKKECAKLNERVRDKPLTEYIIRINKD